MSYSTMATLEKVKKKKGKAGNKSDVADQESKTGSVISVREAQDNDKADTVKETKDGLEVPPISLENATVQDEPPTSGERPQSAQSTGRPYSARSNNSVLDNKSFVSNKSREAWVDQSDRPGTSASNSRPMSSLSKNSVRPLTNGDSASQLIPMKHLSSESRSNSANNSGVLKRTDSRMSSQISEKESNAYVPYMYARNSVAKVVEDMKKMKNNHVRIVHEIEDTYRSIEDETQAQFNAFVLSLRAQYGTKVKTFRQVIELHRLELNQKQQYWDEALNSFGDRNQKLLKDKKSLLIQNKLEYDRMEKEKIESLESLTLQLDESKAALSTAKKDKDDLEEEVKVLGDDNDRLRRELEALRNRPELEGVVVGAAVPINEDNEEMAKLWKQLEAKEKENTVLKKDIKKILKSQAKAQKETDQNKVKRLLEVLVSEVKSIHSEVEMAVLLTEDRLSEVKEDNVVIAEDGERAKDKYDQWAEHFSSEHGSQPTDADRNVDANGKELYKQYMDAQKKNENSELRLTALTMISTGAVPEKLQPKEEPTSSAVAPAVVTETNNRDFAERIEDLEEDISQLKSKNEELEETNKEQDERIAELERLLEEAQQDSSGGVGLVVASSTENVEELTSQISELQKQIDETEANLSDEKSAHDMSRDELEAMKAQLLVMITDLENQKMEAQVKLDAESSRLQIEIDNLQKNVDESEQKIKELEAARLANVPVDTKQEINNLNLKIAVITKERDSTIRDKASAESKVKELEAKLNSHEKTSKTQKAASSDAEQKLKALRAEKDKEIKELQKHFEEKEKTRAKQEEKRVSALEKKIRELEAVAAAASKTRAASARPKTAASGGDAKTKELQEKLREANKENKDYANRIKQLEKELRAAEKSGGSGGIDEKQKKKHEKILIEMEKRLDAALKKAEKQEKQLKEKEDSLQTTNKDLKEKAAEIARLTAELSALGVAAKEGIAAAEKVKSLEKDVKDLTKENKQLAENFNSERVLRKKYYNMVEDMKGKIRVYCRARPLSKSELDRGNYSCIKSPDEYTIHITGPRGLKEFQFDTIFMPESSQEKVFEDTGNLIQSAVDGFNVCIFAYGQTGSGKTFTIIGDKEQKFPGIAPRAFDRIYELIEENKSKFKFSVEVYMMELYNDRLIDLFGKDSSEHSSRKEKLEIKKDKKGLVFVQGAEVKPARNSKELMGLFEEGSKNRHTASTKMNADSSRSHLVVGIIIESTNKTSGQVLKGKLSLVDLAGSERAAKTGAGAEQLKEAMSINKSLSALGDVISALSSEQSFIPYRNNKLTMLMQDSLGGNAKTLMFVNISPADYNNEESTVSLTYASRVKLITNDASKNADNKEISRLKAIISKIKKGEAVGEDEVD